MRTSLVGYTGFVGSNLNESFEFTERFNSKNIMEAYGTEPDLLVYAGIPAEKFIANKEPQKDFALIKNAVETIKKINAKRMVLISTVDVYKNPNKVDECSEIDTNELLPYGLNRYYLEQKVRELYSDALIVRLPGLYGKNIKKNFIYDYMHVIPSMLEEKKFVELSQGTTLLKKFYELQDNGFYKCIVSTEEDKYILKDFFKNRGFSSLNFTDSRGAFQFYPLSRLWDDIECALKNDVRLLNLATEPVKIYELYYSLTGEVFCNHLSKDIPNYDFRTIHAELYAGARGYIYDKQYIINSICEFIKKEQSL